MMKKISFIALMAIVVMMVGCQSHTNHEQELNEIVVETKASLPMVLDEMTVWRDIVVEDDAVVYAYDLIDETGTVITNLESNRENLRTLLYNSVENNDFRHFITLLTLMDKKLVYRYVDLNSHLTGEITFTSQDLEQVLNG